MTTLFTLEEAAEVVRKKTGLSFTVNDLYLESMNDHLSFCFYNFGEIKFLDGCVATILNPMDATDIDSTEKFSIYDSPDDAIDLMEHGEYCYSTVSRNKLLIDPAHLDTFIKNLRSFKDNNLETIINSQGGKAITTVKAYRQVEEWAIKVIELMEKENMKFKKSLIAVYNKKQSKTLGLTDNLPELNDSFIRKVSAAIKITKELRSTSTRLSKS